MSLEEDVFREQFIRKSRALQSEGVPRRGLHLARSRNSQMFGLRGETRPMPHVAVLEFQFAKSRCLAGHM